MALEFLTKLGLSEDERTKLAKLGASMPAALLAISRAAPEAFNGLLGESRASEIASRIEGLLTPDERQRLASAVATKGFPLGATLGEPPEKLAPPRFDIAERDKVFAELQFLRKLSSPSIADKERISELESRLNTILTGKKKHS